MLDIRLFPIKPFKQSHSSWFSWEPILYLNSSFYSRAPEQFRQTSSLHHWDTGLKNQSILSRFLMFNSMFQQILFEFIWSIFASIVSLEDFNFLGKLHFHVPMKLLKLSKHFTFVLNSIHRTVSAVLIDKSHEISISTKWLFVDWTANVRNNYIKRLLSMHRIDFRKRLVFYFPCTHPEQKGSVSKFFKWRSPLTYFPVLQKINCSLVFPTCLSRWCHRIKDCLSFSLRELHWFLAEFALSTEQNLATFPSRK